MLRFASYIFLSFITFSLSAQSSSDFTFVNKIASIDVNKRKVVTPIALDKVENELDLSLKALYLFYKNFMSSQDGNKCAFHPSCSDFSVTTIGKRGLIKGGIISFDRLIRCNGLSPEKYEIDASRKKFIDLVK